MRPVALAAAILAFVTPGPSNAAVPDPTKSHADPVLVGNLSGADMGNAFHVNVRDVGNVPKVGVTVSIVFNGSGSRPLQEQEAGTAVTCGSPVSISRVTDTHGDVFFHARVSGSDDEVIYQVRANGVLLRDITIRSTDLDGNGSTDLGDLNAFRVQYLSDPRGAETDYSQDGVTDLTDFNLFRIEYLKGARGSFCP